MLSLGPTLFENVLEKLVLNDLLHHVSADLYESQHGFPHAVHGGTNNSMNSFLHHAFTIYI